jgi:hypothetical protein
MPAKSRELLQEAGIVPLLKLAVQLEGGGTKTTGPHKVKLIEEKQIVGTDYMTGKERDEIMWIFEEDGNKKAYSVPIKDKQGELHYLIQRMAEVEIGDEIILEAKKKGPKTYIDLQKTNNQNEIPIVEDGDYEAGKDFGGEGQE